MSFLRRVSRRSRRSSRSVDGRAAQPTPLIVKIVGRTALVLALIGVASFVVVIVLLVVGGAGQGHSVEDTPIGRFTLGVALPVFGGSVILSLLLALLNQIGIKPWFDSATALFVRPSKGADWATRIGGLVAGLLLPLTTVAIVVGIAVLAASDVDPDDWAGPLIAIMLTGVIGSVVVAGVAGGIVVMGWFGLVAGLLLGAGLLGVVGGPLVNAPAGTVLGVIAIALAVACYYAGGRFRGTMPDRVGSFAASGVFVLLGVGFFVVSALTHQLVFLVAGVAGVAATVGYVVGALLGRRGSIEQGTAED